MQEGREQMDPDIVHSLYALTSTTHAYMLRHFGASRVTAVFLRLVAIARGELLP